MAKTGLTTASVVLYTVPTATTGIVTEIILANTTAADIAASINLAGTALLTNAVVPANGVLSMGMKQVLLTTETITGLAVSAGVNAFISGVQVA